MSALLLLLLCFAATAARAGNPGPCPSFHAGWALSGSGPITGILWDQYTQQMYFIWNNTLVSDYYPVASSSVIQTFSRTPQANWMQTFDYLVAPAYEAILLQEVDNCPVLQESGGFLWVD